MLVSHDAHHMFHSTVQRFPLSTISCPNQNQFLKSFSSSHFCEVSFDNSQVNIHNAQKVPTNTERAITTEVWLKGLPASSGGWTANPIWKTSSSLLLFDDFKIRVSGPTVEHNSRIRQEDTSEHPALNDGGKKRAAAAATDGAIGSKQRAAPVGAKTKSKPVRRQKHARDNKTINNCGDRKERSWFGQFSIEDRAKKCGNLKMCLTRN